MAEVVMLSDEPSTRRLLRRAWPYLRPHSGRILLALLLSLAESAALVALAPFIGLAVEALTEGDRDRLLTAVALLAGLVVAQALLARFAATTLADAGERVARELRERAAERLAGAPLRFIEAHRDGSLLQRATGEIAELAMFVRTALPNLLGVTATLAFTAVVLLGYSWPLTLVVVAVFLPPALLITRWFAKDAGPAFGAHAGAEATMAGTFAETLDAREELRSAGGMPAWMARFDRDNLAALLTQRRTVVVENRIGAITLVEGAAMAVLLAFGAWLAAGGHLSVSTAVVFVLAGRNLFEGFGDLSQLAGEMQTVRAGLARLLDLLSAGAPEPGGNRPLPARGELLAEEVTFRYEDETEVLRGVSVRFAENAHAGLVGETGSGKTTLSKLLSGLYRPDSGRVTFGGVDLGEASPEEVRRRIALVPQEVHMVSGSVADNLALARGEPGRAEMEAAFETLGIGAFLRGLPRGLDTPAGDLSAGERQILGLVRAVLADPAVLILDEATADVDPVTARSLETALARLRDERALIVIAHRPATIELLPRLVGLRAGALDPRYEN
ncbi:ABC transporter ATP-binding protein [Streptosporangium sp. NPDC001559]|uniref:ABC transporter ATP-binding protein n=1 Tax=Streptosporangium sp. NPDC001559 TaxID=3366187 RepID=UPI0036EFE899